MASEIEEELPPSDTDMRFVERQILAHVDLTTWKPDAHVSESKPACWRRAFAIAQLQRQGMSDPAALASQLGCSEQEAAEDSRLVPYLDRTVAGLLGVLGWYVNSQE